MSGQITRKPRAPRDLADLATYIGQSNPAAAARFLDSAEETLALLAESPYIGSPWESDHRRCRDLRCWPVRGFPNHLVFYRPVRGGIDLIRVLHAARDLERLLTK